MRSTRPSCASFVGCAATLVVALVAPGCGAPQGGASARFASLVVDATVEFVAELDGRPFPVMRHPVAGTMLRVPAGEHRLQLSAEGHLPYLVDLTVQAGEVYDLHVEFWPVIPELDESWSD